MSDVALTLPVMSGDSGRGYPGHARVEGVHEQFAVGGLVYDVAVEPTGDDRVSVTLTGCDDDGQLITSLTGVMPPGAGPRQSREGVRFDGVGVDAPLQVVAGRA